MVFGGVFYTNSKVVVDDIVNTLLHFIKAQRFHNQALMPFVQCLVLLCPALYWALGHAQGQVPGFGGFRAGWSYLPS